MSESNDACPVADQDLNHVPVRSPDRDSIGSVTDRLLGLTLEEDSSDESSATVIHNESTVKQSPVNALGQPAPAIETTVKDDSESDDDSRYKSAPSTPRRTPSPSLESDLAKHLEQEALAVDSAIETEVNHGEVGSDNTEESRPIDASETAVLPAAISETRDVATQTRVSTCNKGVGIHILDYIPPFTLSIGTQTGPPFTTIPVRATNYNVPRPDIINLELSGYFDTRQDNQEAGPSGSIRVEAAQVPLADELPVIDKVADEQPPEPPLVAPQQQANGLLVEIDIAGGQPEEDPCQRQAGEDVAVANLADVQPAEPQQAALLPQRAEEINLDNNMIANQHARPHIPGRIPSVPRPPRVNLMNRAANHQGMRRPPEQRDPRPNPAWLCWNCRREGHRYSDCPETRIMFCHMCGRRGKTARTCPKCGERWRLMGPYVPKMGRNLPRPAGN